MKIAVLAGDGIGPEVTREAVRVLEALGLAGLELVHAVVGGAAYHQTGHPLPAETLDIARSSDAILFGAVGEPIEATACETVGSWKAATRQSCSREATNAWGKAMNALAATVRASRSVGRTASRPLHDARALASALQPTNRTRSGLI